MNIKKILFGFAALLLIAGCGGPDRSADLIVIDAGHGGHDSGAFSGGKKEKDLVLQITKKLYKELRSEGYLFLFMRMQLQIRVVIM